MQTSVERIIAELGTFRERLNDIADGHWISDANEGQSSVVVLMPYYWHSKSDEAARLRVSTSTAYARLRELILVMAAAIGDDAVSDSKEAEDGFLDFIDQRCAGSTNVDRETEKAATSLAEVLAFLDRVTATSNARTILVPDTNALLFNPALDEWEFDDCAQFELVLTPVVLAELDKHKYSRNTSVSDKAETVVRRIKNLRERGRLTDGVPIVKGRSWARAIAHEPHVPGLSWLDRDEPDDRLILAAVAIVRDYPRTPIAIVTRDINMQNKCDFANVPSIEPPPPKPRPVS